MTKEIITDTMLYIKHIKGVFNHQRNPEIIYSEIHGRYSDAFLYVVEGECRYVFDDGQIFIAEKGDAFFLARGSSYNMTTKGVYNVIYCDFDFDTEMTLKPDVYKYNNSSQIENSFKKLYNTYSAPSKTSFHKSASYLYSIYEDITLNKNNEYIGSSSRTKISTAKNYMDIHYTEKSLTVETVAKMLNMSEVHFRKIFRVQYNTSPLQYILNLKIQRAKMLMQSEILSLEECAYQSGFSSLQYFSRVFKEKTGMTPAKYRKQQI